MELVEGATLADRLVRGRLPVDDAIPIATQIAEALEAAHEQGIIHRDLKPANIKVREDGTVKVLDFGLAKALDPAGPSSSASASMSPTITSPAMTEKGVILGTAAYMAPEQARGRAVDKRADIWAFGVVLYEMLAGAPLFADESMVDTLSAVMRKPIDLDQLPGSTPARLRELVRRCLDRDPRRRLRDIGDARIALEEIGGSDVGVAAAGSSGHGFPAKAVTISAIVAVSVAAGAYLLGTRVASRGSSATGAAADVGLGAFTHLTYQVGLESSPSLSPDGEFVVYTAIDGGDRDLFLLRVDGQKAINLTEDSPADEDHPAFSPDGRFIAFRSERGGGGLFVMGATGESVRRLTSFGDNPSWSPDGHP